MKFKYIYVEISLFILCLINLFNPVVPQVILYLLIIGCSIKKLPKEAFAFCCLLFLRDINHAMFFLNYHIPLMSYVTVVIGLYLMRNFILKKIKNILSAGIHLWCIMFIMLFSMIIMENISKNTPKLIEMLLTGTLTYIAYIYILNYRQKINFFYLAIYCSIFAIFLLQLNVICNHYGTPSSLFDFGFYRNQVGVDMYAELADAKVIYATHYQFFGMVCAIGFSLCFAFNKLSIKDFTILFILNLIAIGYTGARQYLIIMILLFAIYLLMAKRNIIGKVLIFTFAIFIAIFALHQTILKDYFDILSDQGILEGSGREGLFYVGIKMFLQNPFLGVGFGGYNFYNNYAAYPHNMIVEILAELGFLGFIVILIITMNNKSWRILFISRKYNIFMMYIIMAYFMRSMISESLAGNIGFFSILSAINYYYKLIQKAQNQVLSINKIIN